MKYDVRALLNRADLARQTQAETAANWQETSALK